VGVGVTLVHDAGYRYRKRSLPPKPRRKFRNTGTTTLFPVGGGGEFAKSGKTGQSGQRGPVSEGGEGEVSRRRKFLWLWKKLDPFNKKNSTYWYYQHIITNN
jgi:hypothetical protein